MIEKKWDENIDMHFSEEEIRIVSRCMKTYPTSYMIKEMEIKDIMRFYFILLNWEKSL